MLKSRRTLLNFERERRRGWRREEERKKKKKNKERRKEKLGIEEGFGCWGKWCELSFFHKRKGWSVLFFFPSWLIFSSFSSLPVSTSVFLFSLPSLFSSFSSLLGRARAHDENEKSLFFFRDEGRSEEKRRRRNLLFIPFFFDFSLLLYYQTTSYKTEDLFSRSPFLIPLVFLSVLISSHVEASPRA